MAAKHYKHTHRIGHGGIKCPCCGGDLAKKLCVKKFRRTAKKEIAAALPSDNSIGG